MPLLLNKIITGVLGAMATAVVLVLAVEGQRLFPLPAVADLANSFWQGATPPAGSALPLQQQVLLQGKFYLFMLSQQWLLWMIPVFGAVFTALFIRRASDEELAMYLTKMHSQEKFIETLQDNEKSSGGHWGMAREAFDKLMEDGADVWLVVGRDGRISRANQAARQFLKVEEPAGHELQQALPWLTRSSLYGGLAQAMRGEVWRDEIEVPAQGTPEPGTTGTYLQAMVWPWGGELAVWLRDVSHFFKDTSILQNSETLLRQMVEESVRPVAVLDNDGVYIYVSPRFAEVLGIPAGELKRGDNHMEKMPNFPPDFRMAMQKLGAGEVVGNEAERVTVNGREEIFSWHLRAWKDAFGRPAGTILTAINQSELHRLRAQTAEAGERENALAYSDTLTGLPNRQLFNDRLNMALAVAHRQLGKLALLFLDLDGFKKVNDTLGHDAGDMLLKQVATRIQGQVRTTDTVARLGGDEFTIILSIRDRSDAEQVAQKLLTAIREPYNLNGQAANVGTSIGIALFPADGQQAADLIRRADAAMYEAKQGGKNTYRFAGKEIKIVS
ncbi:MAG TPA: diguanylate cyclase [Alphaproteobacteria bacterium]|nr:diguanylate cyclase [Alphaproteobacteria bacterium]